MFTMLTVPSQDFLAATEGELYMGAKSWCLRNTSNEAEALKMFLEKFANRQASQSANPDLFLTLQDHSRVHEPA
jgi:hypothetical protein